jgi:N-acetylmuramoyl-L-alanine amidase
MLWSLLWFIPLQAALVVIDPGHGGENTGVQLRSASQLLSEKDITLTLAQTLAQKLNQKHFKTLLTRTQDIHVTLPERAHIANHAKADYFISLHLNSGPLNASGIETYILNLMSPIQNKSLANLFGKTKSLAAILQDLHLQANFAKSKQLACAVHHELVQSVTQSGGIPNGSLNRGVRAGLYDVLLLTQMPSILVEVGFLSNLNDRIFLLSLKGQQLITNAIVQGIQSIRQKHSVTPAHCKVLP